MTEEIMNPDGSRNWQANILLDNIKRLEQERNELKQENELFRQAHKAEQDRRRKYENALEEIRKLVKGHKVADEVRLKSILDEINECIGE
jgi:predicted RNase H-like nuclease (RuvC/YqgF family)